MTGKELLEGMSFVEDELVQESESKRRKKKPLVGWLSMAACLCIVAGSVFAWKYQSRSGNEFALMENAADMEEAVCDGNEEAAENMQEIALQEIPFTAQYIKVNSTRTETSGIAVIQTRDELNEYCEIHESRWNDTESDVPDICDRYDETFFAGQELLIFVPEYRNGITGYEIQSICSNLDNGWLIEGKAVKGEDGSETGNQWCILLEIPKGQIDDDDTITLDLKNE